MIQHIVPLSEGSILLTYGIVHYICGTSRGGFEPLIRAKVSQKWGIFYFLK